MIAQTEPPETATRPPGDPPGEIRAIDAAETELLGQISRLHVAELAPGPLAEMGETFVRDIGYGLLMRRGVLRVGALLEKGRVRGYVAYAENARGYQRQALLSRPWTVAAGTVAAVLRRPPRIAAVSAMLRDMLAPPPRGAEHETIAEIVAIVVDPAWLRSLPHDAQSRRTPTALHPGDRLLDHAIDALRSRGLTRLCARINADRRPALLLYARRRASFLDYVRRGEAMVQVTLQI